MGVVSSVFYEIALGFNALKIFIMFHRVYFWNAENDDRTLDLRINCWGRKFTLIINNSSFMILQAIFCFFPHKIALPRLWRWVITHNITPCTYRMYTTGLLFLRPSREYEVSVFNMRRTSGGRFQSFRVGQKGMKKKNTHTYHEHRPLAFLTLALDRLHGNF